MWRPRCLFVALSIWALSLVLSDAVDIGNVTSPNVTDAAKVENSTNSSKAVRKDFIPSLNVNSSMIQRALYVLTGITLIGLLYFLVRAVRVKKTTNRRKKYGLLSDYDDNMEMAHLESDEDDTTVYEAKALRR